VMSALLRRRRHVTRLKDSICAERDASALFDARAWTRAWERCVRPCSECAWSNLGYDAGIYVKCACMWPRTLTESIIHPAKDSASDKDTLCVCVCVCVCTVKDRFYGLELHSDTMGSVHLYTCVLHSYINVHTHKHRWLAGAWEQHGARSDLKTGEARPMHIVVGQK
jgi:hypothetical protein